MSHGDGGSKVVVTAAWTVPTLAQRTGRPLAPQSATGKAGELFREVDLGIYQGNNTNTEGAGNRARGLSKAPRRESREQQAAAVKEAGPSSLSPRRLFEVFQPARTQAPPSPTARVQLHMYMYSRGRPLQSGPR